MKLKEVEKKENPMLDSTEFKFNMSFDGKTPSRKDISDEIAKQTGAKPDHVSIDKVYAVFGQTTGYVMAKVYGKDETKKKAEQDYLAQRIAKLEKAEAEKKAKASEEKKAQKEKPASEAPAEAPKGDAPAEEKPAEAPKGDAPAEKKE